MLTIKPVLYYTDALFMLLCVLLVLMIWHILKDQNLSNTWKSVFTRTKGMCAAIWVLFFIVITLLDSIHYLPQQEITTNVETKLIYASSVVSVLDKIVSPLSKQIEQTYSAPFSSVLFNKEIKLNSKGQYTSTEKQLIYGGQHLSEKNISRKQDLVNKFAVGITYGLILTLSIFILFAFILHKKHKTPILDICHNLIMNNYEIKWRAAFINLSIIFILIFSINELIGFYHVFGTSQVGNDVLYESIKSIRTGVLIGTLTTLIMLPFAVLLGSLAGFYRGWVDDIIQYLYTTLSSIPGVLLIAAAILSLQVILNEHPNWFHSLEEKADIKLLGLCTILGITSWNTLCRLIRAESLKLRENYFILAAKAFAVKGRKIILRHILPNLMHIIVITIVLDFSMLVLAEAVLSYVGVGVDPTTYSWGNMINAARLEMAREPMVWWSLTAAFIMMFALVLSVNMFADCVKDAFDPKLKRI